MSVQRDSRTFKQASAVSRFGYQSIVVEARPSRDLGNDLAFELRTVGRPGPPPGSTISGHVDPPSPSAPNTGAESALGTKALPKQGRKGWTLNPAALEHAWWRFKDGTRRVLRPLPESIKKPLRRCLPTFRRIEKYFSRPLRRIREPILFARHVGGFFGLYLVRTLLCTPRASLYYLHAFYQFPAVYCLCRRYGARYIYDAHDFYAQLDADTDASPFWRQWVLPFEQRIEQACMRRAAAVVTVNEGIARLIEARFHRRPLVLRNVHDERLDHEPAQTLRERLSLTTDDFLLVSVGNAKAGMAIEPIFTALAALTGRVHLAFVGADYEQQMELARSRGLATRVHFVPPVRPNEVVPFIRTADAAIILYYAKSVDYQFSLPNRFFQPIAAGLPILYPDLPEIRRLAESHGLGLLIDPESPRSIFEAISLLRTDRATLAQLKHNIKVARDLVNYQSEEGVLQNLLTEMVGPP
jgi:glycosyltransferase involved in cell wall biosynthesis